MKIIDLGRKPKTMQEVMENPPVFDSSQVAYPIANAVAIAAEYKIENDFIIEVDCNNYDCYTALPSVLKYNDILYTKTGWSSDIYRACYKSNCKIAYFK